MQAPMVMKVSAPILAEIAFSIQVVPLSIVVDGILNFLNMLLQGIFDFIGDMFSAGLRELLFFESPFDLTGPNEAFQYNLRFALVLLPIVAVIGMLSMPFANRTKAATWRQVWRLIEVIIFIALARPALHVTLILVNATGEYVFPRSYDLSFAGEGILSSMSAIGVTGLALVIGGYVLSGISFLAILFLFFVLFLREFIFNLVYQGFPILIVAWYLDWGPFRTANHIAVVVFRLAGYLVLVGPLIALALQVGVVFGGGSWPPDGQPPADPETTVDFWRQFAGWFMGIALASAFGLKAAMMGGVPMSQLGVAGTSSKGTSPDSRQMTGSTNDESTRISIRSQTRDTIRAADYNAPYSGTVSDRISNVKDSVSAKWNEITDRNDSFGESARSLDITGKAIKPKAGRIAAETVAAGKYSATHLHESPVDWARAGSEHYRNNPIVSNERRARWLIDQQSSRSMQEDDIADRMGWSESKTQEVMSSLESSGHVEIYETGRGNIVMSRDRLTNQNADRSEHSEKARSQIRGNDRDSDVKSR